MRILLLILLFLQFLFAQNYELKLFSKLFTILFSKQQIYIYSQNIKFENLNTVHLKSVKKCKKADLILGRINKKCNKPVFYLDYYRYRNDSKALGAFYWRKGRPQLILRKSVIMKYHLYLSPEFKDYLE